MWTGVLRRVGQALLTLAAAAFVVWCLQLLAPADPARQVLIAQGVTDPTAAQVAGLRAELGLDDAAPVRFGRWAAGLVTGDLGTSWSSGRSVASEVAGRLPATVRLCAVALGLAALAAVPMALAAARWRGGALDLGIRGLIFTGAAVPSFVVSTVVLDVVVLGWGLGSIIADGSWGGALLPAIPLAVGAAAMWARVFRAALVEAASSGAVEVSMGRGATPTRALLIHMVPPATPPLLTAVGMTVGSLLAGAAVVETVFTWPGIGRYLIESIVARDVPVVQVLVLSGVLAYVVASLLVDLAVSAMHAQTERRA
ncbi:ABC transporter permease [Phytoactinopolyspora halotolerans]|uniref:ABC transporter permease n=1 Tax=Phytoactinopolyspora halotolerans TaxID=1981512 RepID=A0A6L9S6J6_9ACTN|nr:ABC transporter permease [Phytoactinopolyspora halotolerans]NEE00172.1 ABC transporter permease [Phytoactinopolyspora halotolerans]